MNICTYMKNIILLFLLLCFLTSKGGNRKQKLQNDLNEEIYYFEKLCDKKYVESYSIELNKTLYKAILHKDTLAICETSIMYSEYLMKHHRYEKSLVCLKNALQYCSYNNNIQKAEIYLNLCIVNRERGYFYKAKEYLDMCKFTLPKLYNSNIAIIKEIILLSIYDKKYIKAIIFINHYFDILEKIHNTDKDSFIFSNYKGLVYLRTLDFDKAEKILLHCLNENNKYSYLRNETHKYLGELYLLKKDYPKSKYFLNKVLSYSKHNKSPYAIINSLITLSAFHLASNNFLKAQICLSEANSLAQKIKSLILQIKVKEAYIDIFIQKIDISNLQESINDLQHLNLILLSKQGTRIYKFLSKNKRLKENDENSKQKQKSTKLNIVLCCMIFMVLFFFTFLLVIITRFSAFVNKLQNQNTKLKLSINSVFEYSSYLSNFLLNDICYKVDKLTKETKKSCPYSSHHETIATFSVSINKIVKDWHLAEIANNKFPIAIDEIIKLANIPAKLKLNVEMFDDFNDLDYDKKLAYLQIVSEFLDNTILHARAEEIVMIFSLKESKLNFFYKDDGFGVEDFDLLEKKGLLKVDKIINSLNATMKLKIVRYEGMYADIYEN